VAEYTPNHLPGENVSYVAGGTITGGQCVILSATGRTVTASSGDTAACVGIAVHDAISGQAVTVARGGEQRPIVNAAVAAGALVKAAAAGRVITWVSGTDNPSLIVGVALATAAASGDPLAVAWRA
jgi:hypothetical protein